MLKKFISAVVGASCVLATFGVAAAPVISTTSTYDSGEITVVTTVTNVNAGDVCTYLAYDKSITAADIDEEGEIIHIDQKASTGTSVTFDYVTEYSNVGSKVLVGGVTSGGAALGASNQDAIPYPEGHVLDITVSVNGGAGNAAQVVVGDAADTDYVLIPAAIGGAAITKVTVNGTATTGYFAAQDGIWVTKGSIANNAAVAITTGSVTITQATEGLGYIAEDSKVVAVGKVGGSFEECGIAFGASNDSFEHFAALGIGSDGRFAVILKDYAEGTFADAETIYARAYTKSGSSYAYGDVFSVSVGGSEDLAGSKQ